jgi:NadR type nicotinamide-nucleotide adenylyltransferase
MPDDNIKKIVLIGPESTGKSTLSASLAAHFSTIWCREYAREYLLEHGTDYTFNDLLTIARGQLILEDSTAALLKLKHESTPHEQPSVLFIDTDMYVMKVWCEIVFGQCHTEILDQILDRCYDGYLLCKPDLPWVKDELREYPDQETRTTLFHVYRDILVNQQVPWFEVQGDDPERTASAISWVTALLKAGKKSS